ncbi:MAG TPA: hypothetical protein VMH22_12390 [bacterium]|nr:hypothetical protein [bacterium]
MRKNVNMNPGVWPIGPWEIAALLTLDYFERITMKRSLLAPGIAWRLRTSVKSADMPIYARIGDVCERLVRDLAPAHYLISGLLVSTLELERILDQFCLAAVMTEESGDELDGMGRRGDKVKAAIGISLLCSAPLATASGPSTRSDISFDLATPAVGLELLERARHADITGLVRHFRQTNAIRARFWREILAYRELFALAESVLGIDSWRKMFEITMPGLLRAAGRLEAKAIYMDCRLRRQVRNNTDPLRNPAARRLNEATVETLSEADLAILRVYYPEVEFGLHKLDEDAAISSLLDATGVPEDPDRLIELLAGRIEASREEAIDAIEEIVARMMCTDPTGDLVQDLVPRIPAFVTRLLAEWPIDYGHYATIDLTEIANWPKGGSTRDKARHWLAEGTRPPIYLLSREEPSLVKRVLAKREELMPTVSREVSGPTTYDGFLRECVLTDREPMMGSATGGEDLERLRRSLEELRRLRT